MFTSGIETHERDGVRLRVYGAAKTVADCFKFRNRLGIQVAIEALRTGIEERKITPAELLRAARTCRVGRIVRPYLEALADGSGGLPHPRDRDGHHADAGRGDRIGVVLNVGT